MQFVRTIKGILSQDESKIRRNVQKRKIITYVQLNNYEKNLPPERIELSTPGLQDQCSNH